MFRRLERMTDGNEDTSCVKDTSDSEVCVEVRVEVMVYLHGLYVEV